MISECGGHTNDYFSPEAVRMDRTKALDEVSKGIKYDKGKVRLELYPPEALFATAQVLTVGATKYDARNWEEGLHFSRVFGALMRHLWAWWKGENTDPETGLNHLHHAGCCIAFLQTYVERKMLSFDDRPKAGQTLGQPRE